MIKNILFDLGGVIITLDQQQAIRRFQEIGLKDADQRLDAYTQEGIFGDLERGAISAETFREKLSELIGKEVTLEACAYAWRGYCKEVPERNLQALKRLKKEGYRLILVSNTNPFMTDWVMGSDFDGHGNPLSAYMDSCHLSYKLGVMKPNDLFFRKVMLAEMIYPSESLFVDDGPKNVAAASQLGLLTYCPQNGEDWTTKIDDYLHPSL